MSVGIITGNIMAAASAEEYPKALYASPDQTGPCVTVSDADGEASARADGAKMLPEWWDETGIPDCEAAEWMTKIAAKGGKKK